MGSVTNNLKPPTEGTDMFGCDRATQKWDFRTKSCVPKTFTAPEGAGAIPRIGTGIREGFNTITSAFMCEPGWYWKPGTGCTKYPAEVPSSLANVPESALQPYEEQKFTPQGDGGGGGDGKTPPAHKTYQECMTLGIDPAICRKKYYGDSGTYLPPVGEATTTPSPFDNPGYYSSLISPSGEMSKEELAYWDTQQKSIVQVYDRGWQEIEAQISAAGAGYGTERQEIELMYQESMNDALNKAYSEIMYTGLQRRLEEKKAAMDFYTNNKSLELSYAIANGQMTVEMLKTYINADVAYAGIEVDMLRAITENAVARATTDIQVETMRQNWLLIAMQLGMSNEQAEDEWGKILGQFGAGQTSKVTM